MRCFGRSFGILILDSRSRGQWILSFCSVRFDDRFRSMADKRKSNRGNKKSSSSAKGCYSQANVEDTTYDSPSQQKMNSRDDSEPATSGARAPAQGLTTYNPMPIPIPEASGRKNIDDAKEKMTETARKEQCDRIANVAAPSVLPKPAIIRHPRNKKQIHAFVEAVASPEKKRERGDHTEREAPLEINSPRVEETRINTPLERDIVNKDDDRVLKLALPHLGAPGSSTSCLLNEESGNLTNVALLSVKAANLATQWLELIIQDSRERLAALRCSKERAKAAVVSTAEVISSDPDLSSGSCDVKWIRVFEELERSLCEEEVNLEKWLNELNKIQSNTEIAAPGKEKDLAVMAAAAALHSTCNFVENRP